ncbi:anaphase-promoting complex subunit cut9 [Lineolata rhizophorae]|uniref:Anaphase-promoting complex subunit cut9 n=1 Tax=Lineolata rhizophorae TaxID=578093 RepID=A0A6A6NV32_9PEZI|nr:anaphase-promoting complex subunit cut9 [Lineolata rhizophorae]
MEDFLREWRQDALNKHQYESAIFIGDKVLALTDDDQDAFWLAQVHFQTGNYSRVQGFLSRKDLIDNNPACKYLAAHSLIKQSKFDEALSLLGDKNPVHLISSPGSSRRKLQHLDSTGYGLVLTRNGTAKGGRVASAAAAPRKMERLDRAEDRDREDAQNIKFEAAMCYLRGVCFAKQNAFDRAKDCYKDAVRIDVQCFEAFDQLMKNSLMSPDEEWKFLESLDFDSITVGRDNGRGDSSSIAQEAADFARMLYTTRLSKYEHPTDFNAAVETLSTHYNLSCNPDILMAKADLLFTQCRFTEALDLTTSILSRDKYNFAALPVHLACLHELGEKNALFLLAHELADTYPGEPTAWLAVGTYYLSINRIAEARRFFSKSSMMDPHFGPAWIGFAHTFAAEGEHDQAISAYSTAARLFQGTHLPQLFLGMQNLQLNNMSLAHEYLGTAYELCQTDPLLLNELGVVFYHEDNLDDAISLFRRALDIASGIHADYRAFLPTRQNLAHALRRQGDYASAKKHFDEVLRLGGRDAHVFTAKGLVLLEMGDPWAAVGTLHEALATSPQDPMASELLNRALEECSSVAISGVEEEEEFERAINPAKSKLLAINAGASGGRKGKKRAEVVVHDDEDDVGDRRAGDSMMLDMEEEDA